MFMYSEDTAQHNTHDHITATSAQGSILVYSPRHRKCPICSLYLWDESHVRSRHSTWKAASPRSHGSVQSVCYEDIVRKLQNPWSFLKPSESPWPLTRSFLATEI
jgi:hypothetical protein